jgi:hypothetical protein
MTMAIVSHFLAASTLDPPFTKKTLEAFVRDLLDEQMVKLPAAILVGEACSLPEEHLGCAGY